MVGEVWLGKFPGEQVEILRYQNPRKFSSGIIW